jgi:glyoxylate/hydroxypyruvate reductase A
VALLIHLTDRDEGGWAAALRAALGDFPVYRQGDSYDPAEITYALVWKATPDLFDPLVNLKALLSLGAGVDGLLRHPRLPDVPIVRFIDDELTQCMTDYIVANVAMHQRLLTQFKADQAARRWIQHYPEAATTLCVGLMGLGMIGAHAAQALTHLGYEVRGWARTRKTLANVTTFAGPEELDAFLSGTDILVAVLPLTPETDGILNYETFSKLRRNRLKGGPVVINAARGGHQRESDLVRALTDGTLGAASLDVFEVEPLPPSSPLWDLPNCYITPHIAAISNERTGSAYFSRVILDHEAGRPLPNVVDVKRGY